MSPDWEIIAFNALSPDEWKHAIQIAGFVLMTTELFKRLWRRMSGVIITFVYQDVWFVSAGMGLIGAYMLWPPTSDIHWTIAGLIVAGAVSMAHRWTLIGLRWKFPKLATLVTGDRRRADAGPGPEGERRRRDR